VTAACLSDVGNQVTGIDCDAGRIRGLRAERIPIYEPDLEALVKRNMRAGRLRFTDGFKDGIAGVSVVFIAVGTPSLPDGSADVSAVLAVAEQIRNHVAEVRFPLTVIVKSTVPVGTNRAVDNIFSGTPVEIRTVGEWVGPPPRVYVVSNPEFLKEGHAVGDFMKPDRVVVGTDDEYAREVCRRLYEPFMRRGDRMIYMDPASAEMTKYAANFMLATRITVMNELAGLCEKCGADIEQVRAGVGSDNRIGPAFLYAGLGYGGSCFPKDVLALSDMGKKYDVDMALARTVREVNGHQVSHFFDRVRDYFEPLHDKTLAVWGLTFKAGTDDVRESPAVRCVQLLNEFGVRLRLYDPKASDFSGPLGVLLYKDAYTALEGCDGLLILTDWPEFRSPDFVRVKDKLKQPVIFDGRNLYEPDQMRKLGFEYSSVGRR